MLLELEEVICPHCRAPRDDMEIEEGRALIHKEELRRKRRPKIIAAGLTAAGLLMIVWLMRGFLTARMSVLWTQFQAEVEKTREPSHWLKDSPPVAPAVVSAPTPVVHAAYTVTQVAVSSFIYINEPAPSPEESSTRPPNPGSAETPPEPPAAVATIRPAPAPTHPDSYMRAGYGAVYDLLTLRPLPGVRIEFKFKNGPDNWAVTNADGHYYIDLEKRIRSSQILVSIQRIPGYRKGQLEDPDPPLRERTLDARKRVMAETTPFDLDPIPLRFKESDDIVEFNIVLVPDTTQ